MFYCSFHHHCPHQSHKRSSPYPTLNPVIKLGQSAPIKFTLSILEDKKKCTLEIVIWDVPFCPSQPPWHPWTSHNPCTGTPCWPAVWMLQQQKFFHGSWKYNIFYRCVSQNTMKLIIQQFSHASLSTLSTSGPACSVASSPQLIDAALLGQDSVPVCAVSRPSSHGAQKVWADLNDLSYITWACECTKKVWLLCLIASLLSSVYFFSMQNTNNSK